MEEEKGGRGRIAEVERKLEWGREERRKEKGRKDVEERREGDWCGEVGRWTKERDVEMEREEGRKKRGREKRREKKGV